jgi:RNA polymerase sigma-70 factor (ECF subfamily)
MSARVKRRTSHDSVPATVPEDGHGAEGPRALETSPPDPESVDQPTPEGDGRARSKPAAEPIDELARRRLNDLFAAHRPAMEARAKQLCRPPLDPDDLVQDALERAFSTQSPVVDQSRMRAWLLRILTNKFIDRTRIYRRLPAHVELDDNLAAPLPSERSMWEDISPDDVRKAIDKLPDDTRETYRLFTVDARSHAEIARSQNIPIATVASRVFRARRQLKTLLLAMYLAKRGKDGKGSR